MERRNIVEAKLARRPTIIDMFRYRRMGFTDFYYDEDGYFRMNMPKED